MCSREPSKAAKNFADVTAKGTGRSSVLAQHFIVSVKPGEVTPQNSYELQEYKEVSRQLLEWYPDKHLPTVDELEQIITALMQERSDKNKLYRSISKKSKEMAQTQQTIEEFLRQERVVQEHNKKRKRVVTWNDQSTTSTPISLSFLMISSRPI